MAKHKITIEDLKKSQNPALQRVVLKAELDMLSSSYTSHNSHYSSSNYTDETAINEEHSQELKD